MTKTTTTKPAGVPLNAKLTKTAAAAGVNHKAVERSEDDAALSGIMQRMTEAQDAFLSFFKVPSWKRMLCAIVTYIAGVAGITFLATTLVEFIMAGAMALAAPMFVGIIVAALAAIVTVYYGHRLVMRVSGAILTKEADDKAAAAYDAVKGAFRRLNPFVKMVAVDAA